MKSWRMAAGIAAVTAVLAGSPRARAAPAVATTVAATPALVDGASVPAADLARPQEVAEFERLYGSLIKAAKAGSQEDRKAAATLLIKALADKLSPIVDSKKVAPEVRVVGGKKVIDPEEEPVRIDPDPYSGRDRGFKRLLAVRALEMARDSGLPSKDVAVVVRDALLLLDDGGLADDGRPIALADERRKPIAAERVRIMVVAAGVAAGVNDSNCNPNEIIRSCARIAALRYSEGQTVAALSALDEAEQWAKKGAAGRPELAVFREAIQDESKVVLIKDVLADNQARTEKVLAKNPQDPAANERRAIDMLAGKKPELASPYLQKAKRPELKRLGAALTATNRETEEGSLEIAVSAAACLPVVPARARGALVQIVSERPQAQTPPEVEKAREKLQKVIENEESNESLMDPVQSLLFVYRGDQERIVFVVDHSVRYVDCFDDVRDKLKAQVHRLSQLQKFAVVMFSENNDVFPIAKALVPLEPETARKLDGFLESFRAGGMTSNLRDPFTGAMKQAFAMQPQIIYFLTDGAFHPGVVDDIKKMNAAAGMKVKINTIAIGSAHRDGEDLLRTIARENGGKFNWWRPDPR